MSATFAETVACGPANAGDAALVGLYKQYLLTYGTDVRFVTVLLASPTSCGSGSGGPVFYTPLANDTRGIGYQHSDKREVYDETPKEDLEGIIFLNDINYWERFPDELLLTFNQEVGHRWGTSVYADFGKGPSPALLGRARVHWSYFLNTDASPMEGNRWTKGDVGTFTSATLPTDHLYHPLDLYLMGLIPTSEVVDTLLLTEIDAGGQADCFGGAVSATSPPQFCAPITVSATAMPVTMEHIVAAEGPRDPAYPDTPREFRMAYVVVLQPADVLLGASLCGRIDGLLENMTQAFVNGTGDRASLDIQTSGHGSCKEEEWAVEPADDGCGCNVGGKGARRVSLMSCASLFLGLLYRRRRRAAA